MCACVVVSQMSKTFIYLLDLCFTYILVGKTTTDTLANSVDPDVMLLQYIAYHEGHHCIVE